MPGFPGVRAVSALGAPRLRRGHELLWAGEDELDPEQRNGIPLSNALPCRASCANAWRKPNGGLRVPASPCCAWNVTALSFCRHAGPPASFARSRPETEPPLFPVPDRQVRPLRTPVPKKVSSGTPATTSALRRCPARSTLSVPRRASRWPCSASAPRKTAPQVPGSAASAPFVVNNARLLPWVRIKHIPCPRTGRAMFARRPGPPLRSASSTARDLLRKPRGNLLPCSQPGSAKHRAAASST